VEYRMQVAHWPVKTFTSVAPVGGVITFTPIKGATVEAVNTGVIGVENALKPHIHSVPVLSTATVPVQSEATSTHEPLTDVNPGAQVGVGRAIAAGPTRDCILVPVPQDAQLELLDDPAGL